MLATQYGMGADALSRRIGGSHAQAHRLLRRHRDTYADYWSWSDAAVATAYAQGFIDTAFGWRLRVTPRTSAPTLMNFPLQANGAEMLRIACVLAAEAEIELLAPAHDAVLIEADDDEIEAKVASMRSAMAQASRIVLAGFELRTDARIVRHPDRLLVDDAHEMWDSVMALLKEAV